MKAHLSLRDHLLVADLENGQRIEAVDTGEMTAKLATAEVSAEEITVADWKEHVDAAPMSGQIIAIKFGLRQLQR